MAAKERALEQRERQLQEKERALESRAKALDLKEKAVNDQQKIQAGKEPTAAWLQGGTGKVLSEPPALASLMVPSPTRAVGQRPSLALSPRLVAFSPPPSAPAPTPATSTTALEASLAFSPPASGAAAPTLAQTTLLDMSVMSAHESVTSPKPEVGSVRKVSVVFERKEKLLAALTAGGAFQASASPMATVEKSANNTSGAPTASGTFEGASSRIVRRSLAELLQEDEARLATH